MIKVFIGENIVLSRKELLEEISKAKEKKFQIIQFIGKNLSIPNLTQALESDSLFGVPKLIIIENFFSLPRSNEKEELLALIKKNKDSQILIWEGKDLSRDLISKHSGFEFKNFRLSKFLFSFLDNLIPSQQKKNIENFHFCLTQEESEMIFAMLIRQIRLLIQAKEGEEYLSSLAGWQKGKISSQAKLFTMVKLKEIFQKLLEIDFQQKTSQSPFDLSSALDLLIAEI